jgi:hypothetical protein
VSSSLRPATVANRIAIAVSVALIAFAVWVTSEGAVEFYGVSRVAAIGLALGAFAVAAGLVWCVLLVFHDALSQRIRAQEAAEQAEQPRFFAR